METNLDKGLMRAKEFFVSKRRQMAIFLIALIGITYLTSRVLGFELGLIFREFTTAFDRFVSLYLPANFKNLTDLLEGLWETIVLSITSGIIGSILAYMAALLMSTKTAASRPLQFVVRFLSTFIRNVPSAVWALILLMAFWFGEFLACLVMTLGSFGFNARVFSETIDEVSSDTLEAMEAVGASRLQTIGQAVYPETFPAIISWTMYAIETNIRESTVIGMLAGGGIGAMVDIYRNFRQFDELMAGVILIVIVVIIFDRLSDYIRKEIGA